MGHGKGEIVDKWQWCSELINSLCAVNTSGLMCLKNAIITIYCSPHCWLTYTYLPWRFWLILIIMTLHSQNYLCLTMSYFIHRFKQCTILEAYNGTHKEKCLKSYWIKLWVHLKCATAPNRLSEHVFCAWCNTAVLQSPSSLQAQNTKVLGCHYLIQSSVLHCIPMGNTATCILINNVIRQLSKAWPVALARLFV